MSEPEFGENLSDEQKRFLVDVAVSANKKLKEEERKEKLVKNIFISLVICVALGLMIHSIKSSSDSQAKYICGVTEHLAHINGAFIRTDTELREKQNKLSLGLKLAVLVTNKKGEDKTPALALKSTELSENAANYWKYNLIPKLNEQASTCKI